MFKVVLCNDTFIYALIATLGIFPCHLPVLAREEANFSVAKELFLSSNGEESFPDIHIHSTEKTKPA